MEKKAVKNIIHGVLVTSPSKHSMEITEYFVVFGLLFLFGGFDFWGDYLFGFCFLGFFFQIPLSRKIYPHYIAADLCFFLWNQTAWVPHQWRGTGNSGEKYFSFAPTESLLWIQNCWNYYAESLILMFLSMQIVGNCFQKWVLETVQEVDEGLYIMMFGFLIFDFVSFTHLFGRKIIQILCYHNTESRKNFALSQNQW